MGHALTVPGGGPLSTRLAEWARDHYLGPVVTFGEWLTYQPPKAGGKPSFSLTGQGVGAASASRSRARRRKAALAFAPPAPLKSLAGNPLPGEGDWRVLATVHGRPAIFGAGARSGLVATFNSGFKIASSGGGFYLNGATAGTLTNGVASVVYYRDGHMTIGVWGQTVRMTPDVVGVRQNLHLIVNHGRVPATVDSNVESSWGATLGGGYYVWRSGIGETRDGRIIFAYGPALNVREIAELLQRAGAVTAMQLDINPEWMSFMYYLPKHHPADPTPFNLHPQQNQPPDRYYSITGRDFTAVYAR